MAGTQPYLSLVDFRTNTLMPQSYVDEVETSNPGFIDARLLLQSAKINARLAKRYDAPFKQPYPIAITEWLLAIVTNEVWLKRGIAATDQQAEQYQKDADTAKAELAEAANSDTGLFELPQREDTDAAGVTRGFPLGYSEQSPYVWATQQARIGRDEDQGKR